MKVIIAGSRFDGGHPPSWRRFMAACERGAAAFALLGPITEVVSGTCYGADMVGEEWAEAHGVPVRRFPADWRNRGRRAGFDRNVQMSKYADALLALWDGDSPGTKHMIAQAEKRGLLVLIERP